MLCLFRVVQEALRNAVKYSSGSEVSVNLSGGDGLTLTVVDNGVGFDLETVWGKGVGLFSMVERLEAVGGVLDIMSTPGGGTRISASVPAEVLESAGQTLVTV
jgi:signal transduction histidine kinase